MSEASASGTTESGASFDVVPCSRADRAEQARLFRQCFKKPIDEAGLVWRYDKNPCGAAVSFLSRPPSGEGVSGYACSPRRAIVRGEEATLATIGQTGDVMTHPDWRKRGLFSALDRAAMAETARLGWPLVFGLPNRRSAHIFVELGWEEIGRVRAWTLLLDSGAAARCARRREGRIQGLLTPLAARRAKRARAGWLERAGSHRARELQNFPPEVRELSRAVERRFAFMIRREPEVLDWRFLASPSGLHRAFAIEDQHGAFAGYAVIQIPRPGEAVGYLVDLLARDEAALACAFSSAVDALERAGASLVQATAIDGTWWSAQLAERGFAPPREGNHLSVILYPHRNEHPLVRAARDVRGWYFTDGDRDDETMG